MALSQDLLQQILTSVTSDPSQLANMVDHPYSTIGNITNNNNVSKEEASQVVTAVTQLAGGQSVDLSGIGDMASQLLGKNNNSVHELAVSLLGGLLGGGASSGGLFSAAQPAQQSSGGLLDNVIGAVTGGSGNAASQNNLSADILSNLAGVAFSGNAASNKQAIDLSDGFGLDDVMGVLNMFMK